MPISVTLPLSLTEVEATDSLTLGLAQRLEASTETHYAATLGKFIDEVQQVDGLDLSSLRHVLVTQDFAGVVHRWQSALGRPIVVTVSDGGDAVGKTLTWRKANSGQAISIVVIQDEFFRGFVHGISMARGILSHELAHIHEYSLQLHGADYEHPDARDLDAVLKFIGQSLASEYFAEGIAARQYTAEDLEGFVWNADTIIAFLNHFEQEKEGYRSHGNLPHIWQQSILTVSRAADMIGRTVGDFSRTSDRHMFDQFTERLENSQWAGLAERLFISLTSSLPNKGMPAWISDGTLLSMFHAIGVYPRLQDGGLHVDIP